MRNNGTVTNSAAGPGTATATTSIPTPNYNPQSGTYNPTARILASDDGYCSSNLTFMANKQGGQNNGLLSTLLVGSTGTVGIGTTAPDMSLSVNGGADKPGGGSWGTFSDRRLKNLDGSFHSRLEQILKINPVLYRYKADNAMGIRDREEHVGVVSAKANYAYDSPIVWSACG